MSRLHEGCNAGDHDLVARLLQEGFDPNEPEGGADGRGLTPLQCVVTTSNLTDGHLEVMRLLLGHGAVVDQQVIDDLNAEAMGSERDTQAWMLLLRHAPASVAETQPREPGWVLWRRHRQSTD